MSTFFTKHWYWLGLLVLLVVATGLRFYLLGELPHGMTWDEAAIGYNGFAIWHAHRDEWLRLMPLSFQSFGDYKAPLAIYLNGFFTFIFGMNLFAVRFPFALASLMAILGFAWLTWQLAKLLEFQQPKVLSLVATALLVFSPWHIHYSRAGFESGMATSFLIWGVCFVLTHLLSQKAVWKTNVRQLQPLFKMLNFTYLTLFLGSGFFVASMYTYHSAKIVVPLIGLLLLVFFWQHWKKQLTPVVFLAVLSAILLLPMVWDSIKGAGATRLSQTSIFSTEASTLDKLLLFSQNVGSHFSPSFLIQGQTSTLRHGDGRWGVLLPSTFIFLIIGFATTALQALRKKPTKGLDRYQKLLQFGIIWLIIGIIPAGLGADDAPHSNRALLALPGFLLTAAAGWLILIEKVSQSKLNQKVLGNHGESHTVRDAVIGTSILLHAIFFLSYWRQYTTVFAADSSSSFQDGYLETMQLVEEYEKGLNGKPQVDKIIFSSEYGQPYIYALFTRKTDPLYYQGGSLIKYEFTEVDIGDFQRANTLIVATESNLDLPQEKADHLIYGSDGRVRFHLYYRPFTSQP